MSDTPLAWIIPGDDNENMNGFLDCKVNPDGEFTRPVYSQETLDSVKLERDALKAEVFKWTYDAHCYADRAEKAEAALAKAKQLSWERSEGWDKTLEELAEVKELNKEWAREAMKDVGDWGSYADKYFQDKWNLTAQISKWRKRAEDDKLDDQLWVGVIP